MSIENARTEQHVHEWRPVADGGRIAFWICDACGSSRRKAPTGFDLRGAAS